jgi:dimethylhistidine N-methyltransferase
MAISRHSPGGDIMKMLKPVLQVSRHNQPEDDTFLNAVLRGLRKSRKELPSKYFYDERGSELFNRICTLDEYYPTRTELHIMKTRIDDIVKCIGEATVLIEYGSGSSVKTRILLNSLKNLSVYVPIDISKDYLKSATAELTRTYPHLRIQPVCMDYTLPFSLPDITGTPHDRVVFFPGSTIGNFHPDEAVEFLMSIGNILQGNGSLLIGVDLKKDPVVLHNAYNDRAGITESFNVNILVRANRELGANFRTEFFKHYAFYNPVQGRIEMHLISLEDQDIHINGTTFHISEGESIHTENSYKYSVDEFGNLAMKAGFTVARLWKDEEDLFSVQLLKPR